LLVIIIIIILDRVCNTHEKEVFTKYTFGNLKGRDVGAYGKVILK
jgi:hypothetical protein